jgi:hypothetical protein
MLSLHGMNVHDSNLQTYEDEWMEYEIEGTVFNNKNPATNQIGDLGAGIDSNWKEHPN